MARNQQSKTTETLRERAAKSSASAQRPKRVRSAALTAGGSAKSLLAAILKRFAFVLIPLRSKPARLIGNVLGKVFFVKYFVSSWRELRQVEWPNRRETVKLTFAVFVFAILFSIAIAVTDFGLDKLFRRILIK